MKKFRNLFDTWWSDPGDALGVLGGKTPVAGFSPLNVTGLKYWADFSDPLTLYTDDTMTALVAVDGDVIGAVADKSGQAHHTKQATAGYKPLYKTSIQNNRSVGRADGSDDIMTTGNWASALAQSFMIFMVLIDRGQATGRYFDGSTVDRVIIRKSAAKNDLYAGATLDSSFLTVNNEVFLEAVVVNGATSSINRNGEIKTAGAGGNNTLNGVTLGGRLGSPATNCGKFDFCEVLVYKPVPSDAEVLQIINYLNTKWAAFAYGYQASFLYPSSIGV